MTEKSGPSAPAGHVQPDINYGGWDVVRDPVTGNHVIPSADLRDHSESSLCWCGPSLDGDVWVHHSMDRREEYERGRKPS